jgi:hypothetical protein
VEEQLIFIKKPPIKRIEQDQRLPPLSALIAIRTK